MDNVKEEVVIVEQEDEEEVVVEGDPMFGITGPHFQNTIQHLKIEPVEDDIDKTE